MYLLLRNNKQSGPHSLEELKSMGLKAYDLVWLEGKSAAWRYPCEIEELKPFAPQVEEQPFDRFYKKPAAAAAGAGPSSYAPVTVETTKNPGRRTIYVNMPAARNSPVSTNSVSTPNIVSTSPSILSSAVSTPPPAVRYEQAVVEDYSAQSMGEPEAPVEFSPRPARSSGSPRIARMVAVGICILALLAAGIFIGLNLNKDSLGLPSRVIAKIPPADPSIVHTTAQTLPAPATSAAIDSAKAADSAAGNLSQPVSGHNGPVADLPVAAKTTPKIPGVKTQKEKMSNLKGLVNNSLPTKDSAAGEVGVAHLARQVDASDVHSTSSRHDNSDIADKEAVKTALASQVVVGANGYSVGTFGGITDLQLTVTNHSVYPLDLVIVEVQYIQANKKVFKTENLYFRSIGAGSALMQEAPKSSRGVRVQYKITAISSKDLGLSYSGI